MKLTFKNLKIRGRLLAGFSIVVGLTLLVGVVAIFRMSELADLTEKLYRHPYAVSTSVRDIKSGIIAMHRSMKDVALAPDVEGINYAVNMVKSYENDIYAQFDLLSERFLGDPKTITNAKELFEDWEPIREEVIDHMRKGDREAAANVTRTKGKDQISEIETAIAGIVEFANTKGMEFNASASTTRRQAMNFMIILLAAAILSGGVIAMLITRSITHPINEIIMVLRELKDGDGDMTRRLKMTRMDEIGVMSTYFDSFLEMIQTLIINVAGSADTVSDLALKIAGTSDVFTSGAQEQQNQLEEIATTVEEMTAMVLETNENADRTRLSTDQTAKLTEEGRTSISKTVTGFESVATTINEAAVRIKNLRSKSEDIDQVIQVIEDIADQTNLLALNANIEAARAGDAGRGFAVVADEVRKLADRTVTATTEISEMIGTIQSEVKSAVIDMESVQSLSDDGLVLVGTSDSALENISKGIQEAAVAVDRIANAQSEQSSGIEQVSKNITQITDLARKTATNAVDLSESAGELKMEVEILNKQIGKFQL